MVIHGQWSHFWSFVCTLWWTNIAMENGPIEIVDFPIKNAWWIFPLQNVTVHQRVKLLIIHDPPSRLMGFPYFSRCKTASPCCFWIPQMPCQQVKGGINQLAKKLDALKVKFADPASRIDLWVMHLLSMDFYRFIMVYPFFCWYWLVGCTISIIYIYI